MKRAVVYQIPLESANFYCGAATDPPQVGEPIEVDTPDGMVVCTVISRRADLHTYRVARGYQPPLKTTDN